MFFVSTYAAAAAPNQDFSGRWRINTSTLKSNAKPTIISLKSGTFKKDNDDIVPADGKFHRVSGGGYVDETSISVESDHLVKEVDKVHGKIVYTVGYVVSADGNTLTWRVASYTDPSGQVVKSETVQRRVGPATTGAHLISGRWERVAVTMDSRSDWMLKLKGNQFSWRMGGVGYDAIIGGKAVKIDGDASGALVLINRPRPDVIVETDLTAQGKPGARLSMQLMPDGKTIRASTKSISNSVSNVFYLSKVAD